MKQLLILDKKNYDESLPLLKRIAVRGIIYRDGKLLMVSDRYGHYKFPGGGQEENETDIITLAREIKEETGYDLILDSVIEYGEVLEKRKSSKENMIWHHTSRYYICDVSEEHGNTKFTENEKKYGMYMKWCTIDEAINRNKEDNSNLPWNEREYHVLLSLKEF